MSLHLHPLPLVRATPLLNFLPSPTTCAVDNFQHLRFGNKFTGKPKIVSHPTSSQESLKHKSMLTFQFHTIYPYTRSMARSIVAERGGQLFATDGWKLIATNTFRTNGKSALLINDRRDCHIYPTRRQCEYLQICSARLYAAATLRGKGAKYGGEGTDDHEGWRACHYDTTVRWGRSKEIDEERTAGHDINDEKEGFGYCSACPFFAPFSSVFHTPKLGRCLKSNKPGNEQYVFLQGLFTPSTSGIYSRQKKFTVDVGYHYTNSSSPGMICTNGLMNFSEKNTNRANISFSGLPNYDLKSLGCIIYHLIFVSPIFNVDSQQINRLMFIFIYHCFYLFAIFMLLLLAFLGNYKMTRIIKSKDWNNQVILKLQTPFNKIF